MMPTMTIALGAVLIAMGVGGYFATDQASMTALIPAFFGVALAALGGLAMKEKLRKHAMHAAAALALLGMLGNVGAIAKFTRLMQGGAVAHPIAVYLRVAMLLLCMLFVLLCVKSFIDARRKRQPA